MPVAEESKTSKKQKSTSYPEDPKIVSQKVDTPKKEKKKKTDKQNLMVDGEDMTVKPGNKQKKRKAEEEIKKEETADDNEDMNEQREGKQKKQKKRKVQE